ncbi:MAG: SCO family protein [Tabrizicola sp.]|nr:SCO family protein [Tabrizicola sp.]
MKRLVAALVFLAPAALADGLPFPVAIGGSFLLTDQFGETRSERDPAGHPQLLFFGYANCEAICSVALPQMAEIEAALDRKGIALTPVMITVDPARDTVKTLAEPLARLSPDFIGLTGEDAALASAYKAFSIENTVVFEDPAGGKIYAHGSFLYLLDSEGRLLTVLPPILSTERMVEVIEGYVTAG